MTNDKLDAIKARNRAAFATDDTGSLLRAYHLDVKTLLAEVERLKQELDARKYVVSAVSVHIKQAAALFKRF